MKYFRYKAIGLLLMLACLSCKNFVDISPSKTEVLTPDVFANNSVANLAITGLYSQMANEPGGAYTVSFLGGLLADEIKSYSNVQTLKEFYTNSVLPSGTGSDDNLWAPSYKYIYQANSIIENVEKSTGISEPVKRQLVGEAKFVRAFYHFYLTNFYGDIPIVTTTDYKINNNLNRSPQKAVYDQIILDLLIAKSLLNINYVGMDGLTNSPERIRPNKWVASALLSRIYLYTNEYAKAEKEATEIIENGLYELIKDDINKVFLKNSKETIWQLQPNPAFGYTIEGSSFILSGAPDVGSIRNSTISQSLMGAFQVDDIRRSKWIGSVRVGTDTYYFPYKYKNNTSSTSEYSMVFRLGEQFLIRAEARAQQNKITDAKTDLNEIRLRAGLHETSANDKNSMLLAINYERRFELFMEWGHRWFDLKRNQNVDQIMTDYSIEKAATWQSYKQLLPISNSERQNNRNLSQNLGYEGN